MLLFGRSSRPRTAFSLASTVVALMLLGVLATLFLVISRKSVTTETAKSVMVEDLRRLATSSALSTTSGGSVLGATGATFSRDVTPVLDVPIGDSRVVVVRHAKAKDVVCQVATGSLAGSPTCGTPEPTPTGSVSVTAERVLVNDAPRTALVYRLTPLFTSAWTGGTSAAAGAGASAGAGSASATSESGAEAVAIQLPDGRVETFTKTQLSSLDYTATVVVDTTVGADDVMLYAVNGSGRVRANGGALPGGGTGSASSNFTASALEVVAGQPLSFSATGLQVGGQPATAWNWRFGDGTFSSTVSPSKTFMTPGTYTVTLQMANSSGMVSTPVTRTITVTAPAGPAQNQAPTAVLTANRVWAAPSQAVTFSATGSLDSDGTIVSYRFTSGGGASQTSTSPTFVASYRNAGTYTATLTVTDNSGATTSQSLVVTVSAAAAPLSASRSTAVLSSTSSVRQAPVTLTVTARDANGVALSNRAVTLTGTASLTFGATTGTTNASGVFTTSVSGSTVGAQAIGVSIAGTALTSPPTLQVILGAPTSLTATGPSTTTSGATLAPISVQLRESGGLAVPVSGTTVTASLQSGGGTLGGTLTAVSDANGVATFSTLTLSGLIGSRTVRFSAPGLSDATLSVDLQAGTATTLIAQNLLTTLVAGTGLTTVETRPQVRVEDVAGNPVSGVSVSWTVVSSPSNGGSWVTGQTSTSDANGIARLPLYQLAPQVGTTTWRATALAGALTRELSVTTIPGAASQVALTTQPSATASAGVAFASQPTVQLRDANGNAVAQSGVVVTASVATGTATLAGTLTATTDGTGAATFSTLRLDGAAGSHTLSFSAPSLTSATSSAITLGAGAASALSLTTAPAATATVGTAFATQPVVQIRDAFGNAVSQSGVVVTASRATGTASLLGTLTATTNASGVAAFATLRLEGLVGAHTLRFDADGLSAVTSPTVTLAAGPAASLVPQNLLTTLVAGTGLTTFETRPQVRVQDVGGNPVSGVSISWTVVASPNNGGSWVTGQTSTSDASGLARLPLYQLAGTVGTTTWRASALSGALTQDLSLTTVPGAASQVAVTTQPSATASAGTPFATQPVVQLRDANGNAVSQSGVVITASRATGPATLAGTLTATTNASGQAAFTDLRFDGTAGSHTLTFSAAGLTSATSAAITLGAGTATALAITTQPGGTSAPVGAVFTPQPVLQLRDAFGNNVSQSGVTVTASVASGSGTLGGTTTAITNASGVATFTNLQINTTAGSHTLAFNAPSLTGVTSAAFTVAVAVSATTSQMTRSLGSIAASTGSSTSLLAVTVRNASSQVMPGVAVSITASGTGNTISPASGTTDANGVFTATFSSTRAEVKTFTVVAGGVTLASPPTITVAAAAASKLVLVGTPAALSPGVLVGSGFSVRSADAFDNFTTQNFTVSGEIVGEPAGTGAVSFSTPTSTGGVLGAGPYSLSSSYEGTSGTKTLRVNAAGLTSATATVSVTQTRASAPILSCSATTLAAGQEATCTITGASTPASGRTVNAYIFRERPGGTGAVGGISTAVAVNSAQSIIGAKQGAVTMEAYALDNFGLQGLSATVPVTVTGTMPNGDLVCTPSAALANGVSQMTCATRLDASETTSLPFVYSWNPTTQIGTLNSDWDNTYYVNAVRVGSSVEVPFVRQIGSTIRLTNPITSTSVAEVRGAIWNRTFSCDQFDCYEQNSSLNYWTLTRAIFTNGTIDYTTPGTYTLTVPAGVTSITATASGAGGAGVYYEDCLEEQFNGTDWICVSPIVVQRGGSASRAVSGQMAVSPGQAVTIVVAARHSYYIGGAQAASSSVTTPSASIVSLGGYRPAASNTAPLPGPAPTTTGTVTNLTTPANPSFDFYLSGQGTAAITTGFGGSGAMWSQTDIPGAGGFSYFNGGPGRVRIVLNF